MQDEGDAHDLGDGMAAFRLADGTEFRLDLIDFLEWRYRQPAAADGYAMLRAVSAEVAARAGVTLTPGQADALLHAVELEMKRVQGKRQAELG